MIAPNKYLVRQDRSADRIPQQQQKRNYEEFQGYRDAGPRLRASKSPSTGRDRRNSRASMRSGGVSSIRSRGTSLIGRGSRHATPGRKEPTMRKGGLVKKDVDMLQDFLNRMPTTAHAQIPDKMTVK